MQLRGRVLLMFQPGEEGYPGARTMLEEGLLDLQPTGGRPATGAFAIHISTNFATRHRPSAARAQMAVERLVADHGSRPRRPCVRAALAVDPIVVAAEIILGLQTMVTRRIDAFDPAVVTIAHVGAGTTNNIIPETAISSGHDPDRVRGDARRRPAATRAGWPRGSPRPTARGRASRSSRATRSPSTTARSRRSSRTLARDLAGAEQGRPDAGADHGSRGLLVRARSACPARWRSSAHARRAGSGDRAAKPLQPGRLRRGGDADGCRAVRRGRPPRLCAGFAAVARCPGALLATRSRDGAPLAGAVGRRARLRCARPASRRPVPETTVITLDADRALDRASALDAEPAGEWRGPLHGVALGVKDLIDVAGLPHPVRFASLCRRPASGGRRARRRAAGRGGRGGGGERHTHEFAYGPTGDVAATGPARNPHDTSRITGGSSSGSAAAVAAGHLPLALGTDMGASIRTPAALCGEVGLKHAAGPCRPRARSRCRRRSTTWD